MIHYRPPREPFPEKRGSVVTSSRHRQLFLAVEVLLSEVREAKHAADRSLLRAQEAPEPHVTTNTIFVALYEAHLSDREALFATMRRLDEAREALRAVAAGTAAPDSPPIRRTAG